MFEGFPAKRLNTRLCQAIVLTQTSKAPSLAASKALKSGDSIPAKIEEGLERSRVLVL